MARKKKQPIKPEVVAEVKEALDNVAKEGFNGETLIKPSESITEYLQDLNDEDIVVDTVEKVKALTTEQLVGIGMMEHELGIKPSDYIRDADTTTVFEEESKAGKGQEVDYFELYEQAKEDMRVQQSHYEYLLKEAQSRKRESEATHPIEQLVLSAYYKINEFLSKNWFGRAFSNKAIVEELHRLIWGMDIALNCANNNHSEQSIIEVLKQENKYVQNNR